MADDSIPWYKSSDLRLATYLGSLVIIQVCKKYGIVINMKADDVADWLTIGVVGFVLVRIVIKRIRRGKDPADPAPAIKTPGVVKDVTSTVSRLTK